jgi:hypothetical protein
MTPQWTRRVTVMAACGTMTRPPLLPPLTGERRSFSHGYLWTAEGIWERLSAPKTLEVLTKNGIEVEVLQTEAAAERFNELRETMPVGGLFHSTC